MKIADNKGDDNFFLEYNMKKEQILKAMENDENFAEVEELTKTIETIENFKKSFNLEKAIQGIKELKKMQKVVEALYLSEEFFPKGLKDFSKEFDKITFKFDEESLDLNINAKLITKFYEKINGLIED